MRISVRVVKQPQVRRIQKSDNPGFTLCVWLCYATHMNKSNVGFAWGRRKGRKFTVSGDALLPKKGVQ